MSESIPFLNISSFSIPIAVIKGDRPLIPQNCLKSMKKLIQCCWSGNSKKRPSFYKIVDYLSKMHEAIPQNEKSQITVDLTELTINVKPRSRSRVLLTDEEESVNIKKS